MSEPKDPQKPAFGIPAHIPARATGEEPSLPAYPFGEAPPVAERVRYIIALMAGGFWDTSRSYNLAEAWGLDPSTVWNSSTEASRIIKASINPDMIRATALGRYDRTFRRALEIDDVKAAIASTKGMVDLYGTAAPAKFALTDTAGNDLPVFLRGAADHPELARFALLHGRTPTEEERTRLLAGAEAADVVKVDG